ncbi:MAG: hypothetical protein PHT88_01915 [Candidatus Moranbacteria bacterium]|nr:hypothetical protein [Candidatus Moranbacteria bacterium]
MTTIQGSSVALEKSTENRSEFLEQLKLSLQLKNDVIEAVSILLHIDELTEESWQEVIDHFGWKDKAQEHILLIHLIEMVQSHKNGALLVDKILSLDSFYYEHFKEVLKKLSGANLGVIDKLVKKIRHIGAAYNDAKWEPLATEFIAIATGMLSKSNDLSYWYAVADTTDFRSLDYGFVRDIAFFASNHNYGYILLEKLVSIKILHLKDLIVIAKAIKTSAHPMEISFKIAIWEAVRFCGRRDGHALINEVYPPVCYPSVNSHESYHRLIAIDQPKFSTPTWTLIA